MKLTEVCETLLSKFGPQGWWPMDGGFSPREWEVCLGAILTQNTSWKNVEKALENLKRKKITSLEKLLGTDEKRLAELIRPSGYYNQKAGKLKDFSRHVKSFGSVDKFLKNVKREELLEVNGIGPETADSILLYACGKPHFVIDAYTRRVFSRIGIVEKDIVYDELKKFFEKRLPKDAGMYGEFHALIVELGKNICKKKPLCKECPLKKGCRKINV